MTKQSKQADTNQACWARFRFSVVGPLLSCPPQAGEVKAALTTLSKKQWQHPVKKTPLFLSVATIERWYYQAKKDNDPVNALRTKRRKDAAHSRQLGSEVKQALQQQYREHPSWSYQLHLDNLKALCKTSPALGKIPSYSTVLRYLKANGLYKQKRIRRRNTAGAQKAQARLASREVRSYEVQYIHSLWHLDFHHGSRNILGKDGRWRKPYLLAIIDDHSRVVCHAQWFLSESTASLVHGFKQALQKRGLPRALMSDNGSAMTSAEFTQGLERLGILHQPTLPYSPYQNAKQEVFWAQVEGRLMAMMEGETELSLSLLNEATIAWIEFEYHRRHHSELGTTPLERYLTGAHVGRDCPNSETLTHVFCEQITRKQRRSDGTLSLNGCRFELPSQYRHITEVCVRYRRWDLRRAFLFDKHTQQCLATLYPQDKTANADAKRRQLSEPTELAVPPTATGLSPLLKDLMTQYQDTGLPPAYLPQPTGDADE